MIYFWFHSGSVFFIDRLIKDRRTPKLPFQERRAKRWLSYTNIRTIPTRWWIDHDNGGSREWKKDWVILASNVSGIFSQNGNMNAGTIEITGISICVHDKISWTARIHKSISCPSCSADSQLWCCGCETAGSVCASGMYGKSPTATSKNEKEKRRKEKLIYQSLLDRSTDSCCIRICFLNRNYYSHCWTIGIVIHHPRIHAVTSSIIKTVESITTSELSETESYTRTKRSNNKENNDNDTDGSPEPESVSRVEVSTMAATIRSAWASFFFWWRWIRGAHKK